MNYQPLFDYLHELGLIPIQTEMQEIIHIVKTMKKKKQINALRARIERIEKHLAEQHIPNNFSKSNLSEKPNSSEEYDQKPDFIPDWKDAPEDAVCVAMDKGGQWYWYDKIPGQKNTMWGLNGAINPLRKATNASRLHPDYWKSTLMMRPEAGSEPVEPVSEKDYSHLLPEGYEFCEEGEAEKWVKVEKLPDGQFEYYEVGAIFEDGLYRAFSYKHTHYRPIRPIQYHIAVHEAVTAVPDPYMPDWTKAPEGKYFHCYDMNGMGYWYGIGMHNDNVWTSTQVPSGLTLPSGLDWKQSLRVKPSK